MKTGKLTKKQIQIEERERETFRREKAAKEHWLQVLAHHIVHLSSEDLAIVKGNVKKLRVFPIMYEVEARMKVRGNN
jgi:hypothetical protein